MLSMDSLAWDAGGRRIVGPLDLRVAEGEIFTVVGPNGAGKTTLMRLISGILAPSEGSLSWKGRLYEDLSRRDLARRIAYVPQSRPVRVPLTVEQLVLLGRYPHLSPLQMVPDPNDFAAVAQALELVGVESLRERLLAELSGGERQAVYIAAALAQESTLLVLDEPTTHLDPRHQREIAALLLRLNEEAGRTVVLTTHDLNFAALVADRVLALKAGDVLACDVPGAVLEPRTLEALFEAPFRIVRDGDRPLNLLELG